MTLDELLSMSIGDRVINCGNIWQLNSIHHHDKNCSTYYFNLSADDDYKFRIQVNHDWETKTTFFYNHEDTEYYSLLSPFMKQTDIYNTENYIKVLDGKKQYYFSEIDYIDRQIEKLRN